MPNIHERRAKAAACIQKARDARDRLKSSKPSMLNATTKLAEAMEVMDALIDALDSMQHQPGEGTSTMRQQPLCGNRREPWAM